MAKAAIDKLNNLEAEVSEKQLEKIDYDTYFGEMDLTEEEKEERKKMARRLELIFLAFFLAYLDGDQGFTAEIIYEEFIQVAIFYLDTEEPSAYIKDYARRLSEDVVKTTEKNSAEYYTSLDRAMAIAANESNIIGNYKQLLQAIKIGKKEKQWITMRDRRVRHTHVLADGQTVGILEPFTVGDSKMMFPKDQETYNAKAEEIVNCRCVCKYL